MNLSLLSPGKVARNDTWSDQSLAENVISQLPSSSLLSHFRVYDSQAQLKITCADPDVLKLIGMEIMIPWTLRGMDSATFVNSDPRASAVIVFQSASYDPMMNPLATSSLIMETSYLPSTSMGSSCPCLLPKPVAEALAYQNLVYSAGSFMPEKAER